MHLTKLRAQNIRSVEQLAVDLAPGINLFTGDNGAGKTSILEAVDILSRGQSFRSHHILEIITHKQEALVVSAELISAENVSVQLGIEKNAAFTKLRVNQNNVAKWSDITQHLPLLTIHPESYKLVTGGPGERRKFLDWGLFHVEPQFIHHRRDYNRALKQRNYCLRNKNIETARAWHQVLVQNGHYINDLRTLYCTEISEIMLPIASKLGLKDAIILKYARGWKEGADLEALLEEELNSNNFPARTISGPHRADILFTWNDAKFAQASSRGQQKVFAIALKLAQARHLMQRVKKSSIYLVDELPAELDRGRCEKVLRLLADLESQILITSISKDAIETIPNQDINWFHVKHGQVSSML